MFGSWSSDRGYGPTHQGKGNMKKSSNVTRKSTAANKSRTLSVRSRELLSYAQKVAETTDDWMQVFNAVYAPGAIYGTLFPTKEERTEFARTAEHKQLYELLWRLRDQHGDRQGDGGPSAG
ncbi:MAG TPA: hypothetical protein PK867_28640, partial [Pirellulales bacterium]|nr:hypothetical protein [Pirellulales bacterium]